jgi:hypothetical protein
MKAKRIISTLFVFTFILALSACNLPNGGTTTAGTPDIAGTVAVKVAIEQAAQTMVAQTLSAAAPVVPATPTSTNTLEAPVASFTPSLTPTITLTSTAEGVSLVVSQDTFCRQGAPYAVFKSVTVIKSGQQVEVIARNPENDSYYVKNPYAANSSCWIYGKFATVSGNTAGLVVSTLQPTPTPTFTPTPNVGFSLSYAGFETCAPDYGLKFYIKNTSSTVWQYISISGTDTVTSFGVVHTSNKFNTYSGCHITLSQEDLANGEDSYVLAVAPGQLGYDPTGHLFNMTVKLCSLDNALGTCISKPISFTP